VLIAHSSREGYSASLAPYSYASLVQQ